MTWTLHEMSLRCWISVQSRERIHEILMRRIWERGNVLIFGEG